MTVVLRHWNLAPLRKCVAHNNHTSSTTETEQRERERERKQTESKHTRTVSAVPAAGSISVLSAQVRDHPREKIVCTNAHIDNAAYATRIHIYSRYHNNTTPTQYG